ncbi:MAG: SUMF1/EgtB/PvdO family nonheme iron enzyme [Myxococcales bacterium]|nr:SUMF1/EgtB/PvdO family nonheme iron enzyme [Myxococcales bacterium]MCB9642051.1 SUMF1/EgtB/PvdO family nonheme iron enzyme [Myxococcales bacterium]
MRCEVCRHENPPRSRFCVQCGRMLDASWLTPTPESAPAPSLGALSGRVGEQMGDYVLIALLGEGGMGRVYRARNKQGEEVALKMLPPLREGDKASRRLLRREGEILSRLLHPSIVRFDDFIEDRGRLALAMELLQGKTLHEKLAQGPLAPDLVTTLLLDILEGLIYAHGQGVIHRDLKPSNIFLVEGREQNSLDPTLRIKIGDFGLARMRFEKLSKTLEHVGEAGTIHYMAPEQIQQFDAVDARSDLYALGAIAYEALVGSRMISMDSHVQMIQKILNDPPPALAAGLLDRLPTGFAPWLHRLLAKDPNNRFESAEQARSTLLQLVGRVAEPRTGSSPSHSSPANPVMTAAISSPQITPLPPSSAKQKTPAPPSAKPEQALPDPLAWEERGAGTADFHRDDLGLKELSDAHLLSAPLSQQEEQVIFAGAAALGIPATGDLASPSPALPNGLPFSAQMVSASPSQGTSDFNREAYLSYQRSLQTPTDAKDAVQEEVPNTNASDSSPDTPAPSASSTSSPNQKSPSSGTTDTPGFVPPDQVESFETLRDDDERTANFREQILSGVRPLSAYPAPETEPSQASDGFGDATPFTGPTAEQDTPDFSDGLDSYEQPKRWKAVVWLIFFAALGTALWWGIQKGGWDRWFVTWKEAIFSTRTKTAATLPQKTRSLPSKQPLPPSRRATSKRPPKKRHHVHARTTVPRRKVKPPTAHPKPLRVPHDLKRMARIPKGWFPFGGMGSPSPIQWRRLPTFWMDRYEVTWHDYNICVKAKRCSPLASAKKRAFSRHNQPVVGITWEEAAAYCRFRNKRLPSSLEWEKAARGFEGQIFPFSGAYPACNRAVYGSPASRNRACPKHPRTTMIAGSKPLDRSPFGIFDMTGNVREWTRDCAVGEEGNCKQREARGGSWLSSSAELLAARRWNFSSSSRRWDLGFRCVWP